MMQFNRNRVSSRKFQALFLSPRLGSLVVQIPSKVEWKFFVTDDGELFVQITGE